MKFKLNSQKLWYHSVIFYYFAYNSGRKLKSYFAGFLSYGNPELQLLGSLKNRLHICSKYNLSHHDFEA